MALRKTVYTCPAFIAYELNEDIIEGQIKLTDGMSLAVDMGGDAGPKWRRFTVGALRMDDLKTGETMESYVAKEIAKGGRQHWINADAACITSHKQPQEKRFAVEVGATVLMQGVLYTIERAANDNLKLVKAEA